MTFAINNPVTSATATKIILNAVSTADTTSFSIKRARLPNPILPGTSSIKGNRLQRVVAACVLVMGLALFGNGIVQRVVA